ncbi:MAG: hypothetical protein MI924_27010 [Chloroflexales bacterium]|nr:hypothetical protein [Chloroflexales bacterium]
MMMNFNRQQTKYVGLALIALGVFALLRLWWLLPVLLLGGGGVYLYLQRRRMGQVNEAIQLGLWGIGLAVLSMLKFFFFPGLLLLAGASLLLRGHEAQVDSRVQALLSQFLNRRNNASTAMSNITTDNAPTYETPKPTKVTIVEDDQAATGETVRLK